jgi:hypothetical protein
MGLRGCFIREVEGLRIILASELEHFLATNVIGPELALRADHQVFEIDHANGA